VTLLEVSDLRKDYRTPDGELHTILDVAALSLAAGEQVAIAGPSGSGKTTFLNIIAGILRPDAGRVVFDGTDLTTLSEGRRDAFRATHMGYVFQTFNLLEGYTAFENVLLGMLFGAGADRTLARTLLEELGLGSRMRHRPGQLSSGQQQRVALARALANRPRLVLADEPTGNLDPTQGAEALRLIREMCHTHGAALLLVSHDPGVLADFDDVLRFDELNRASGETA